MRAQVVSLRHREGYLADAAGATPTGWTNDLTMVIARDMVTGRYGTLDVPLKALPVR